MILGFADIHLSPLLAGLRKQADLAALPAGQDPFAHDAGRAAVAEAAANFRAHVEDCVDQEADIRRALAWLLSQPDALLQRLYRDAMLPYPTDDAASQRRYYERLWEDTFARWQIEDAYPEEELVVLGLP